MSTVAPFDLRGPLPTGVTVLEASAGTGKTYTIAALAARFIAGGARLDELLLVTFTRMATGELRERVRERLVATERALTRVLAGAPPELADDVVAVLAAGRPDQVAERRDRLAAAIADFDAATIATTHGFCQEVLDELGTLGDLEPDVTFVEDVADLVEEVVDDLYVRRFHRRVDVDGLPREAAGEIARIAIENPTATVHPLEADPDSVPAVRRRLALAARQELTARKRRLALMTYDDLLTRLRDTLAGANGAAAAARLRARYRFVLIDEFQDTDPIQWEIVDRAFGEGDTTLVLIGDPKQAIYAFRGADVYAYLAAVRAAGAPATLDVNRRSDQPLLDGFDALFGSARLGHPGIAYRKVSAAPCHRAPRLHGAPSAAALRIRVVDRTAPAIELTGSGFASRPSAREHVARDLAADVVELLSAGARIERRADSGATLGSEPVAPGDVAVLVPSHRTAALIQSELDAAGVPAVVGGAGSVFATPAASDWLALLEAIERPASPARARAAALTPLIGWDATAVAGASEDQFEQLHRSLYGWARMLRVRGVAALAEAIMLDQRVPGRILAQTGGERHLTDLQHIAQLLHAAAFEHGLGVAALTGWLRQRLRATEREGADEELARRLESDAEAVQVLTIHRAKGLEFPIVYCPYLWEPGYIPDGELPVYFHDSERGDERAIDVGLEGPGYGAHRAQFVREERGEDLRLAYVALTRARHQVVVWWAGSYASRESALGRLVFAQSPDGDVGLKASFTPSDAAAFERFEGVAAGAPQAVAVEWSQPRMAARWDSGARVAGELSLARLDRRLDLLWRRTSYSAITAAAHEAWVASEPEERGVTDEPSGALPLAGAMPGAGKANTDAVRATLDRVALPLAAMAAGPRVGTAVHRALEAVDFTAERLPDALSGTLAAACERGGVELGCAVADAGRGLAGALATPLGGALGQLCLTSIARRDRLDELAFELPLAGGDDPVGQVGLVEIAALLARRLDADDPLAAYAERLADPALNGAVRGYLTGTIDLVLRLAGADGRAGYALVDYKTNWLAAPDEELSAGHYRPQALAAEMDRSHYALQALLYTVALHRYLRWRAPGYDPAIDLLGVHYLFLRGMVGPDTPAVDGGRCGVFAWRPPPRLVTSLSDLLDGRVAA
jgi:exodeoxyribonuclease V beta subunit